MKLSKNSIEKLKDLISAASVVDIDQIIIDEDGVRGINETRSVVLFAKSEIEELEGLSVGFTRLGTLASRISLIRDVDGPTITLKTDGDKVAALEISGKGTKVGYRCAATDTIKTPKRLTDVAQWGIDIGSDDIPTITAALKAMGSSKRVNINTRTGSEVFLELVDEENQDAFTIKIADGAEYLGGDDPKSNIFVHTYPAAQFMAVLKAATASDGKISFQIGAAGTLQIKVGDYQLVVVSQRG